MLFCQLGRVYSLREICGSLVIVEGKLNQLGIGGAPARSTLSYQPVEKRCSSYFLLLLQFRPHGPELEFPPQEAREPLA